MIGYVLIRLLLRSLAGPGPQPTPDLGRGPTRPTSIDDPTASYTANAPPPKRRAGTSDHR